MKRMLLAMLSIAASLSLATVTRADTGYDYYFSMRLGSLGGPQFVNASPAPTSGQSTSVSGCDGATYYLTSTDAAQLSSALSSGATVQLHQAPHGTAPQGAPILCMVQAGQ